MKNVKRHDNLHHCAAAVLLAAISSTAMAVNDQPLTEKWAPSVWGPDDMAGSVNWKMHELTPEGALHLPFDPLLCLCRGDGGDAHRRGDAYGR